MLSTVVIVLLVLALLGVLPGAYGRSRGWGYYGWSPLGLIVLLIILALILHW